MNITREHHFTPAGARIADAALTVLVRDGFDALSVRTVATEAGVAPGTVQYHMGTRDELIAKAFIRSIQRQQQRVEQAQGPSDDAGAMASFVAKLAELLPTGPTQREDAATWVIIGAAASTRGWLADLYTTELNYFQQQAEAALEQVAAQGRLRAPLTPAQGARLVTALINGLTIDTLNAPDGTHPHLIDDLTAGLQLLLSDEEH